MGDRRIGALAGAHGQAESPENAPAGLDWEAFSAAYFPGRHRHDLEAITAYGKYRRAVEERTSERAGRTDEADDTTESTTWEDEGGAVSQRL